MYTAGCQTGCQPGCTTRFDNRLNEQWLFVQPICNRVDNRFDNRLYRVNGISLVGAHVIGEDGDPTGPAESPRRWVRVATTLTVPHEYSLGEGWSGQRRGGGAVVDPPSSVLYLSATKDYHGECMRVNSTWCITGRPCSCLQSYENHYVIIDIIIHIHQRALTQGRTDHFSTELDKPPKVRRGRKRNFQHFSSCDRELLMSLTF